MLGGCGEQTLYMEMDTAADISSVILGRHSFSVGMTLCIYLYSDAACTIQIYDSTLLTIDSDTAGGDKIPWGPSKFVWASNPWGLDNLAEEFSPKANYVHWITTPISNVLSIKIVIDVPSTVDIEIGRLIIGEYIEPTYNSRHASMQINSSLEVLRR